MSNESTPPGVLSRTFRPQWVDIAPVLYGVESDSSECRLDHATAKLWTLILASRAIPYRMRNRSAEEGGGHGVQTQVWSLDRAVEEIRLHRDENIPDGRGVFLHDLRPVGGREATMALMLCMLLFFWIYNRTYPAIAMFPQKWLNHGSAEALQILNGEWWRVFTALTLHGDGAHVLGNAIIGGVFIWLAARRLGSGLAWILAILGGGIGNWVNAMVLGPPHNSIGFSTASFAAAGLLAGVASFHVGGGQHGLGSGSIAQRILRFLSSALIPFAAGLGLLAMLGAGEDTDLGAHLFGFISGLGLGTLTGLLVSRTGLPSRGFDIGLYICAMGLILAAWGLAWLA